MEEEKRQKALELLNKLLDMIEDKPDNTIKDRPEGNWKVAHLLRADSIYCPICGFTKHIAERRKYNYCPSCGADLRGSEDKE